MDKSIKIQRTQSVLRELIPEALSTLSDEMLRGLCVTEVECSRGKYDATVYLDKMAYDAKEKSYILSRLEKVKKHIQNHCMQTEGWFRCPNFKFEFENAKMPITISLGVASRDAGGDTWDMLFEKADQALYKSKKRGRNQVSIG